MKKFLSFFKIGQKSIKKDLVQNKSLNQVEESFYDEDHLEKFNLFFNNKDYFFCYTMIESGAKIPKEKIDGLFIKIREHIEKNVDSIKFLVKASFDAKQKVRADLLTIWILNHYGKNEELKKYCDVLIEEKAIDIMDIKYNSFNDYFNDYSIKYIEVKLLENTSKENEIFGNELKNYRDKKLVIDILVDVTLNNMLFENLEIFKSNISKDFGYTYVSSLTKACSDYVEYRKKRLSYYEYAIKNYVYQLMEDEAIKETIKVKERLFHVEKKLSVFSQEYINLDKKELIDEIHSKNIETNINKKIKEISSEKLLKENISELPEESKIIFEKINDMYKKLAKDMGESKDVEKLVLEKLPEILQKFSSLDPNYRHELKNVEGKTPVELLNESMVHILRALEECYREKQNKVVTDLSVAQRYLKSTVSR